MNVSNSILSDITVHMKYAKYREDAMRRETWQELVDRNKEMHIKKYPELKEDIESAYEMVYDKKVLPSMRSLQFGGKPIEKSPNRIYNCAYAPIDDWRVFSEIMFLLLGGTGVGYSVQRHHVEQLPAVVGPNPKRKKRFLIGDSIEGWADAVKALVKSYFFGTSTVRFDFSDIRPKGSVLKTSGGKAPGPQPLRECLVRVKGVLESKEKGSMLTPIEVHDIVCYIADAVLAGGIRRAALIALFSEDDDDMMSCKSGAWWEKNPQRGRANNSAVLMRHNLNKEKFVDLWKRVELSKAGEPGIYMSNDKDWGTNPCCEIALRPYQFCNLVEVNVSDVKESEELNKRVAVASFIATLQAGYTDFHYLRSVWQRTTEKDALIGVSMTGIASGALDVFDLEASAKIVKDVNQETATKIGIKKAARTTCVKPAGTTSLVLGTSSGVHAWHNDFYIRRIRVNKEEAIYKYLVENHPDLIEDDYFSAHTTAVISIPQKAPEGALFRTESPFQLLERIKGLNLYWVKQGHRVGENTHNVSATVSLKDDEWDEVVEWMWENRDNYNGLSVLPYDGGTYKQAPFEDCTEETYNEMMKSLKSVDLTKVIETYDTTNLSGELACAGNSCEIL